MITSRPQTQARKLHGAAWSMRSWDEIMIARITATGEVADQCLETRAADSPLRTAVPLLLILRAGGGTGTTLTSSLMRLLGSRIGSSGVCTDSQCGVPGNGGNFKRRLNLKTTSVLG